jgi:hypothetical protein
MDHILNFLTTHKNILTHSLVAREPLLSGEIEDPYNKS